jgi:hypothetical protein
MVRRAAAMIMAAAPQRTRVGGFVKHSDYPELSPRINRRGAFSGGVL